MYVCIYTHTHIYTYTSLREQWVVIRGDVSASVNRQPPSSTGKPISIYAIYTNNIYTHAIYTDNVHTYAIYTDNVHAYAIYTDNVRTFLCQLRHFWC